MADETPTIQLPPTEGADVPAITTTTATNNGPSPAAPSTTIVLPSIIAADLLDEAGGASGTLTPTLGGTGTGPGTGTATPLSGVSDIPLTAEQRSLSLRVSLADVAARASAHYAQRRYDEAAEVYAQAAEMQAEMNGEMAPENAEILFLYGRSLFKVGQGKSDVLGGRAPAEGQKVQGGKGKAKKTQKKAAGKAAAGSSKEAAAAPGAEEVVAQEAAKIIVEESGVAKTEKDRVEEKKPLFQFTGDENWDDSDEEEDAGEDAEGEEDEDEVEDDLGTAFEILDLARLLYLKQLEEKLAAADTSEDKGKDVANGERDDAGIRHVRERLADTHDLLAEISLENERYPNAIADARESLKYKQQLVGPDSEIIAEAHFKLSLSLEFASVTSQQDDESAGGAGAGPKEINQELRDEAARELEAAINSTKLKLQNKEVELATLHSPEDNDISRTQIAETKEIIAEMEQRLVDLRGPPIDVQAALGGDPMGGILGAALGESAVQTEARIEEAKKTATDLTGLVRKKGKPAAPAADSTPAANESSPSNGTKRKAEDEVATEDDASKKPRTEEEATS